MTDAPLDRPAIRVQGMGKSHKAPAVLRGWPGEPGAATMPGPVRAFAEHRTVTSIVNAIRDLFAQQPVGSDIWVALGRRVAILVVAYGFAMATYRRKIS